MPKSTIKIDFYFAGLNKKLPHQPVQEDVDLLLTFLVSLSS